jgi:hypothetical protein
VYVDEPGAPDYDAMVMLNMTVLGRTEHPDHNPSTDSQITH